MSRKQRTRPTSLRGRCPNHRLSPAELVQKLLTSPNAAERSQAIRLLQKYLRRGDRFHATWEALGGARGTASLMAQLSVADVHHLCRHLGRTASAVNARTERRGGLAELVHILMSGETDSRPLRKFYQYVVPASHGEVVQAWENSLGPANWTKFQESCLQYGHREQHEQRFLREVFPELPGRSCGFAGNENLFRGNLAFCEKILNHLLSLEGDRVEVPTDFMPNFAMPLLNRFVKRRRSSTPELHKFLRLIVSCVQQHPNGFKHALELMGSTSPYGSPSTGILAFTASRWVSSADDQDRAVMEAHLECLLALLLNPHLRLSHVHRALLLDRDRSSRWAQTRYTLLKLIFKNVERFRLDIESETPASLQRLKAISSRLNLWPAELFTLIPADKSLSLLDRLERAHQDESFISTPTGYGYNESTILQQASTPSEGEKCDIDIVRTVLQRRKDPSGSSWLPGVPSLVKDRMKKAAETREPRHRAFWAKSALNICVASGELGMIRDTFVWAQRFVNDPLVCPEVHGLGTMTRELEALLTAVPIPIDFETSEGLEDAVATAKRDVQSAEMVVTTLIQTAISAIREPSFRRSDWSRILQLPQKIAQRRTAATASMRRLAAKIGPSDIDSILAETIWKPTVSFLLRGEALMSIPCASELSTNHGQVFSAGSFMQGLPTFSPILQADMTQFFLTAMKTELPSALAESHVRFAVSAVSRLAHGSQPALAIPFIRPIIQNSHDSSSHRQLLTNSFLESLSAHDAAEFLRDVADAMTEKMKEQNSRPWKESGSEKQQPAIKVTTIKMMADLLNGTRVVGADTSCDILVSLLREARHIDARIAIITSLLGTLEESTSTPALRKTILDVFEDSVLPMASQLNERRPTTEEEWHAADMPEVSETSSILTLLVRKVKSKGSLQADDRARLVQIVMHALERSAQNNQRWADLFIERHGFAIGQNEKVVVGPAHLGHLETMFDLELEAMPEALYELLQTVILQNVDPPTGITRITRSIKSNAQLRTSNAGKHWLAQFDKPTDPASTPGLAVARALIQKGATSPRGQIRINQLRRFLTVVAECWACQGRPEPVYSLASTLTTGPGSTSKRDNEVEWRANGILLLHDIIRSVEEMQKDGNAAAILVNTFRLRLHVLRLAHWTSVETVLDSQTKAFAELTSSLVDRLASRQRPYHRDFALLKTEFTEEADAKSALALAGLDEGGLKDKEPSLASYLRFELVADGLKGVKEVPKDDKVRAEVRALVERWNACQGEDLRAMGQQLEKDLKKRKQWYSREGEAVVPDA